MSMTAPAVESGAESEAPAVVIEMGGTNIVVRATDDLDHAYTSTLADVLDAAIETDTTVVIDPHSVRCDDAFAAYVDPSRGPCTTHQACRPEPARAVATGMLRLRAERGWWTVDVRHGRVCRSDVEVDVRFLGPEAWTPIVAVCVTPRRLIALGVDGAMTSARRAHRLAPAA